jgi:hypothetical protein
VGLWNLKSYSRILQIVNAAIGLFAVPVGKVIGALSSTTCVHVAARHSRAVQREAGRRIHAGGTDCNHPGHTAVERGGTVFMTVMVILGTLVVLGVITAMAAPRVFR